MCLRKITEFHYISRQKNLLLEKDFCKETACKFQKN